MRLYTFVLFTILVTSYATISLAFDVDGDGKEGLAESIHALQVAAGLNPAPPINCTAPDEVLSLGRCWKDRNLGANRVATSSIDSEGYGDLYQWGRQVLFLFSRSVPTALPITAGLPSTFKMSSAT